MLKIVDSGRLVVSAAVAGSDPPCLFGPYKKDLCRREGKGRRCFLWGQNYFNSLPRYSYIFCTRTIRKTGRFAPERLEKQADLPQDE